MKKLTLYSLVLISLYCLLLPTYAISKSNLLLTVTPIIAATNSVSTPILQPDTSGFNPSIGRWEGCADDGSACYTYIYDEGGDVDYIVEHMATGMETILTGKWRLEKHPTGGNGLYHYNVTVRLIGGIRPPPSPPGEYPMLIVSHIELSNFPATPSITLKRIDPETGLPYVL